MGTTFTVTAKGQVTLRKEVWKHLGVAPGQKVEIDRCRTAVWKSARPNPGVDRELHRPRVRPGTQPLTIEEITEIAAEGRAGRH